MMNKITLITICRVKMNKAIYFAIFLLILVLIGPVATSQIDKATENLETNLCEEKDTDSQGKKKSISLLQNYWQLRFWNASVILLTPKINSTS